MKKNILKPVTPVISQGNMVRKQILLSLLGLAFVSAFMIHISLAASDTVSVNVTVQSVSQMIVVPDSLNWTSIATGATGGLINLTIQNSGSVNLTNIFVYVNTNETETWRPYGSDRAANFSSGGVLVIKNSSASKMYWAQKKEWNWTMTIPNMDLSAIGASSRAASGFFRNTTFEYIWAVGNGTNSSVLGAGLCNNTGALFAITDVADTGSTATRTPSTTTIARDGGDAEYGYFSVNRAAAPISGMCVAVRFDCSYILIYKYDKRSNFGTCVNAHYLRSADLAPGQTDTIITDAYVPYGIPTGQMAIATMTVQASP
jgi:hypothetical protein